jgi:pimeloyl-ACP methyl ester carboxylesterase
MRPAPMTPEHPSDPPMRSAWLPEGPFSYTEEGEGPALVLLHGLPGSVRDYRWLAPALDGVRLVRIEQPAFGSTPRATEPGFTLEARARFVVRALEALGIERCALLGHSMGGPLALAVAAEVPERVSSLVLLASVGLRPHRMMRRIGRHPLLARALEIPPVRRAMLPSMRKGFVAAGFPPSTTDEAIVQCTRIFQNLRFSEIRDAVTRVRAPSFLAWAEDDPLVEGAIGLELGRALPAGPRISWPEGGHNIQKSRAIELGRELSSWLSRSASSATSRAR